MNFEQTFFQTIKKALSDKGVLLMIVIAPIIYGLYYPWPYSSEIVRNVEIGVIDNSNSELSRELIRNLKSSPITKLHLVSDEFEAKEKIYKKEIIGYLIIPNDFKRKVLITKDAVVDIVANAGFLVEAKNALSAIAQIVLYSNAQVNVMTFMPKTKSIEKSKFIANPISLFVDSYNNPNSGYASYVVPAVAWLILQQTFAIGAAMLVSTLYEQKTIGLSISNWISRICALSFIHIFVCMLFFGWIFIFWDFGRGQNLMGTMFLILIFSPTVATIGCLLGCLIRERERTIQALIFSSLPIYFLSGFSWPFFSMPEIFKILSFIFPTTHAIKAGVGFNELGGSVSAYLMPIIYTFILGVVAFIFLIRFYSQPKKMDSM